MSTSYRIEAWRLALLGRDDLKAEWESLCTQLRQYHFDAIDYAAYRYLALFNEGAVQRKQTILCGREPTNGLGNERIPGQESVAQLHSGFLFAWAEWKSMDPANLPLYKIFPQFRYDDASKA